MTNPSTPTFKNVGDCSPDPLKIDAHGQMTKPTVSKQTNNVDSLGQNQLTIVHTQTENFTKHIYVMS